jgi:putative ABC transport system substrate-binding protein
MTVKRRALLAGFTAALPLAARAEAPRRITVGFVSWWPTSVEAVHVPPLRKGLAALGYIEPQSLELLLGFAGGEPTLVREATRRFVARGVDVIVVTATPAATIVKEETQAKQVPVVMSPVADPLATGLVQSIARPGGNLTGMSMAGPDLSGKRLQILRDLMPGVQTIGFVGSTRDPNARTFVTNLERVAAGAGLTFTVRLVDGAAQIDDALMADFKQAGAQVLFIQPIFMGQQVGIVATATRAGLPSVCDQRAFTEAGSLFSYGFDDRAGMERAAYFIDRIVRGTKPADLPIELPTGFVLVVNRKAAAHFGLTIPPGVLAQADEIIE